MMPLYITPGRCAQRRVILQPQPQKHRQPRQHPIPAHNLCPRAPMLSRVQLRRLLLLHASQSMQHAQPVTALAPTMACLKPCRPSTRAAAAVANRQLTLTSPSSIMSRAQTHACYRCQPCASHLYARGLLRRWVSRASRRRPLTAILFISARN